MQRSIRSASTHSFIIHSAWNDASSCLVMECKAIWHMHVLRGSAIYPADDLTTFQLESGTTAHPASLQALPHAPVMSMHWTAFRCQHT